MMIDIADFLNVDTCTETGADVCWRYMQERRPIPTWVMSTARVELAESRNETPRPFDVKAAGWKSSMWPRPAVAQ